MNVTNIVVSLISGIIGASGAVLAQRLVRREKFKDALYREKLSEYRVISEKLWKAYASFIEAALQTIHEEYDGLDAVGQVSDISACASKSIVISKDATKKISKFCIAIVEINRQFFGKKLVLEETNRIIEMATQLHIDAVNALRKDIGTDLVSDDIHKTLKSKL